MEKVLNVLSDLTNIDEKAAAIIANTNVEKKELYKQLTDDMKHFDDEISKITEKKLSSSREKLNLEIDEAKKGLLASFERDMSSLESDFQKNHDTYVETVFQKIISQ